MRTLALEQLRELEEVGNGAIQILAHSDDGELLSVELSLDTSGLPHSPSGIAVRSRERFQIVVSDSYPFEPPRVFSHGRRWAGTPHVQWGRYLCIYASPSVEWNPSEGVRGFISRLHLWLQRAAAGTLDPEGQPLHPPTAYTTNDAGRVVVHGDLGDRVPWANSPLASDELFAWCSATDDRLDVLGWFTTTELFDHVLHPDNHDDLRANPRTVAYTVLLKEEIGFEYPGKASDLVQSIEPLGFGADRMIAGITRAAIVNNLLDRLGGKGSSVQIFLATPARSVDGHTRLAHLAAWKLDGLGTKVASLLARAEHGPTAVLKPEVTEIAKDYLGFTKLRWMPLFEDRPEVTVSRDFGSSSNWFTGKRVLVLGCGALGAPIAEQVVRAKAASVNVLDNKSVGAGVLVRQPFYDADIGLNKAQALSARLSRIYPNVSVTATVEDAKRFVVAAGAVSEFDLIIDATADAGVRGALELARVSQRSRMPALITPIVGHRAERGVVAVSTKGSSGGAADILRRLGIVTRAGSKPGWTDIADDLFPMTPRTDLFFPEPGCSSPTFVGSAAEVTALASTMLASALGFLTKAGAHTMAAIAVRMPSASSKTTVISWPDDVFFKDSAGRFEIRISRAALNEVRAEARRGARTRGSHIETGGMLIGEIDTAVQVVYVDVATGPPPDSRLAALYFDHGTAGTQELLDSYVRGSGGSQAFVGLWHTHPDGRAWPSETDKRGMASLLSIPRLGRRALMLIFGGRGDEWEDWLHGRREPSVFARVVDKSEVSAPAVPGWVVFSREPWWPGGYGRQDTES